MAENPEPERLTVGPTRPLAGDVVDALREAVIVIDAGSPGLPLILVNSAARRSMFEDPSADGSVDASLYAFLGDEAPAVVGAALHPSHRDAGTVTRYLTWRLPRGVVQISTEIKLLESEAGSQNPTVMLKFLEPAPDTGGASGVVRPLDQMSVGLLLLDKNLIVTFADGNAACVAGQTGRGMLGMSSDRVIPISAIAPEAFDRALRGLVVREGAVEVASPGFPTRWFEVEIHPLIDTSAVVGLALLVRETSGLPQPTDLPVGGDQPSTTKAADNFRGLIAVVPRDGTIQLVSGGVTSALGFVPADFLSKSIFAFMHPVDGADLEGQYVDLCAGSMAAFSRTVRMRQKNDRYCWLELTFVAALDNPRIAGIVVYARDISPRERTEARLAQREEIFKLVSDAVNGVIFEWDLYLGIVHRSRGVKDLLDMDPKDLEKAGVWTSLIHPQDNAAYQRQVVAALESGRGWSATYRIRTAHGQYRSVMEKGIIQRNTHGYPIRVIGFAVDVSEIRRLTDLLAEAQRVAQIGGWEYSYGTAELECTEEAFRMLETTPAQFEVSVPSMLERCAPSTRTLLAEAVRNADASDGRFDLEFEVTTLKQRSCWVRLVGLIEKVDGKPFRAFGSVQNIQSQKLAQIELENRTDWLKLSMGMADLYAWRWYRTSDTLEFAIVDGEMVNLPRISPGMRKFMSRVHPKDRAELRDAIELAFQQHTEVNGEFRLKTREGLYRAYAAIARPLYDAANQPNGLVGVTQDVTARHESQARLRRSEELLRTTTANTADTLVLVDNDLVIRFINRDYSGLTMAQLIGREVSVIFPPGRRESLLAKLRRVLATGETETFEFEFPHGPSKQYFENRAVLVRQEGIGTGISIAVRDITERKRMEAEILDISNRERQAIGRDLHDGLGQELTGVALMLRGLATRIESEYPESKQQVEEIVDLVNRSIDTARALARGLLPVTADAGGLNAALGALAERAREMYGFEVKLRINIRPNCQMSEAAANHLYRITQEALTNAARHAHASSVVIQFRANTRKFLLRIIDDGIGISKRGKDGYGMGLKIMRYRASMINAVMEIAAHDPRGTVVCVTGKLEFSMSTLESADAT